jgi:hypothetical protein
MSSNRKPRFAELLPSARLHAKKDKLHSSCSLGTTVSANGLVRILTDRYHPKPRFDCSARVNRRSQREAKLT